MNNKPTQFVRATIEVCMVKPENFNNCGGCLFLLGKKAKQSCALFIDTCPNGLRSSKCKEAFENEEFQEQIKMLRDEYGEV